MVEQLLLATGLGAVLMLVAGRVAASRLRRRYPAPGRLIDVGGQQLHVLEQGVGNPGPVVILETGTWNPGLAWEPVLERLGRSHHVVAYDRAGLGWSEQGQRPRTALGMAEDLALLIDRLAVRHPIVVVGHSFGGLVAKVLAFRRPDLVAGLVLVDAAHEEQLERFPAPVRRMQAQMTRVMPVILGLVSVAVRTGLVALRPSLVPAALGPLRSETLTAIRARVAIRHETVRTMAEELRCLEVGYAEVRALAIDSLGDLPLVVISHGRSDGVPPQLGREVAADYERVWQELQARQAALSTRGRRVVATRAGHNVPTEAPDLVASVVSEIVDWIRAPVSATA